MTFQNPNLRHRKWKIVGARLWEVRSDLWVTNEVKATLVVETLKFQKLSFVLIQISTQQFWGFPLICRKQKSSRWVGMEGPFRSRKNSKAHKDFSFHGPTIEQTWTVVNVESDDCKCEKNYEHLFQNLLYLTRWNCIFFLPSLYLFRRTLGTCTRSFIALLWC